MNKLELIIIKTLKEQGKTVTAAESCTGGMICSRLVDVPGASEVFKEGFVTYSNEAKMRTLGVKAETIEMFTEVSEQCACEMAKGAAQAAGADIALSTTGYAGPDGADVGLVYIGFYSKEKSFATRCLFSGTRNEIRASAASTALEILAEQICI